MKSADNVDANDGNDNGDDDDAIQMLFCQLTIDLKTWVSIELWMDV